MFERLSKHGMWKDVKKLVGLRRLEGMTPSLLCSSVFAGSAKVFGGPDQGLARSRSNKQESWAPSLGRRAYGVDASSSLQFEHAFTPRCFGGLQEAVGWPAHKGRAHDWNSWRGGTMATASYCSVCKAGSQSADEAAAVRQTLGWRAPMCLAVGLAGRPST